MVRPGAVHLLLSSAAAACLLAACGGQGGTQAHPAATSSRLIAVITTDNGAASASALATALSVARQQGFDVRRFEPPSVGIAEQARLIGDAIAARARAIVLAPIDYSALLPYLRAAHDAQIPVVLMQTPRDQLNPAFVASFIAPNQDALDTETVAELARLTANRPGTVAVISARPAPRTAGGSLTGLGRELRRVHSRLGVLPVTVDATNAQTARNQVQQLLTTRTDLTAIVTTDLLAAQAVSMPLSQAGLRRPSVIATTVDSVALDLLSRSVIDAAIGPDTCAMTSGAMRNAIAAAENDVTAISPGVTVDVRTLRRGATTLCG